VAGITEVLEVQMRRLVGVALLVAVAVSPARAQFPSNVGIGTRVRVIVPDTLRQEWGPPVQLLRGDVAAITRDTLVLQLHATSSPLSIPRSSIRRLERSLGVNRFESALRGALFGAITVGLAHLVDDDPSWREFGDGAAVGAPVGFVLGVIWPTERWRRVRLR
jgi:hypothetical protein